MLLKNLHLNKNRYRLIVAAVFITLPFIQYGVARAIEAPDSAPSVSQIRANTNLLGEGDILIYGDYNIPYETIPDIAADEAYSFVLLDESLNQVGSVRPYVLMDNGYNKGGFSFYFDGGGDVTWGGTYTIRIAQSPSHFALPHTYDYVIPSSAWTSYTEREDNQNELSINIIMMAQRLESFYSGDYAFMDAGAGGTVLSSPTGETYFRGCIYGLQAMAPNLFLIQVLEIDTDDFDWDANSDNSLTTQTDNYTDRTSGSWADPGDTEEEFGLTPAAIVGLIFTFPVCIGFIVVSSMRFRKAEPGVLCAALVLILALVMGWMPPPLFATIYQALGIYVSWVWFYSRG